MVSQVKNESPVYKYNYNIIDNFYSHYHATIIFSSAVSRGSGACQMPTCPSLASSSASTLKGGGGSQKRFSNFLAPPAERQRSFSNTDLSVVRLSVRPSVRPSVCLSVRPSRLRGGGVYLRNASVTFPLFWHEASFG